MEITTIQKNIRISPRKLRLVADLVRKMTPVKAMETLRFVNKRAALPLIKAIKTVLANAKMQNLDPDNLVFEKLEINEEIAYKRYRFVGRGRIRPYKKRGSQIKIVLTDNTISNLKSQNSKLNKIKELK